MEEINKKYKEENRRISERLKIAIQRNEEINKKKLDE
jgi:hypothetical protein